MFILLFILGLLPFAAGYGLTQMPKLMEGYFAYVTAGVFLILWFFIAKLGKLLCKKTIKTTGHLNLPGFLFLLVIAVQIVFFTDKFMDSQFGTWTSWFFSPVRPLGILIANQLPEQYFLLLSYVCSFLLLLIVAFFGAVFTKAKKADKDNENKKGKGSYDGSGLAELARRAEESTAELERKE